MRENKSMHNSNVFLYIPSVEILKDNGTLMAD